MVEGDAPVVHRAILLVAPRSTTSAQGMPDVVSGLSCTAAVTATGLSLVMVSPVWDDSVAGLMSPTSRKQIRALYLHPRTTTEKEFG